MRPSTCIVSVKNRPQSRTEMVWPSPLTCHGDGRRSRGSGPDRSALLAAGRRFSGTDKPASGESKRAPRDKQANRRTQGKRSIKQFKGKS